MCIYASVCVCVCVCGRTNEKMIAILVDLWFFKLLHITICDILFIKSTVT